MIHKKNDQSNPEFYFMNQDIKLVRYMIDYIYFFPINQYLGERKSQKQVMQFMAAMHPGTGCSINSIGS